MDRSTVETVFELFLEGLKVNTIPSDVLYEGATTMDWNKFGNWICRLALIALKFYQEVNGQDERQTRIMRRQVAAVIHPDSPAVKVEDSIGHATTAEEDGSF